MHQSSRLMLAAAALALASSSAAFAQSSPMPASSGAPMPAASPGTSSMTMPPSSPGATGGATSMPSSTSAPSSAPAASAAPSASAAPNRGAGGDRSTDTGSGNANGNNGKHKGQIKKLRTAQLTPAQVQSGVKNLPLQLVKLRGMKTIKFSNLSMYRLTATDKKSLHISDASFNAVADALFGAPVLYASTTMVAQSSGNSTATNLLHNVLANVNVSDALNNVLNNSTVDVKANVSLQDVLNNVNVGIGQVVGIYIGTGGSVTTIVGG